MNRTNLTEGAITGTPVEEEDFSFDPTGNWPTYEMREYGETTLDQTRGFQQANEITSIDSSSSDVGYDANGNMTKMPAVDGWSSAQTLTYDAWNRVMSVRGSVLTIEREGVSPHY